MSKRLPYYCCMSVLADHHHEEHLHCHAQVQAMIDGWKGKSLERKQLSKP